MLRNNNSSLICIYYSDTMNKFNLKYIYIYNLIAIVIVEEEDQVFVVSLNNFQGERLHKRIEKVNADSLIFFVFFLFFFYFLFFFFFWMIECFDLPCHLFPISGFVSFLPFVNACRSRISRLIIIMLIIIITRKYK